jgi:hypothetical protein
MLRNSFSSKFSFALTLALIIFGCRPVYQQYPESLTADVVAIFSIIERAKKLDEATELKIYVDDLLKARLASLLGARDDVIIATHSDAKSQMPARMTPGHYYVKVINRIHDRDHALVDVEASRLGFAETGAVWRVRLIKRKADWIFVEIVRTIVS